MVIAHNLAAMNSNRQFKINTGKKSKTAEKLASGYRINRAADDAAGLAISEKMRKQIRGLQQGVQNTQDGISLCQVADGALAEVHEMLQRANELAVQAANGTNSESDRKAIQMEVDALKQEIDRISDTTEFNKNKIFDGNCFVSEVAVPIGEKTIKHLGIDSIIAEGNPHDKTIGSYVVDAVIDEGIYINNELFEWNAIYNGDGKSLDSLESGVYSVETNGIKISFNVLEGSTLNNIIESMKDIVLYTIEKDGPPQTADYIIDKIQYDGNYLKPGIDGGDIYTYISEKDYWDFFKKEHIIQADLTGISIDNGVFYRTWESGFSYYFDHTQTYDSKQDIRLNNILNLNFDLKSFSSFEDFVEAVNGVTFTAIPDSEFEFIEGDFSNKTSSSAVNKYKTQIIMVNNKVLKKGLRKMYGYNPNNVNLLDVDATLRVVKSNNVEGFVARLEGNGYYEDFYLDDESKEYIDDIINNGGVVPANSNIKLNFCDSNGEQACSYRIETYEDTMLDKIVQEMTRDEYEFEAIITTYKLTNFVDKDIKIYEQKQNGLKEIYIEERKYAEPKKEKLFLCWIQSGAEAYDGMYVEINNMNSSVLGIDGLDVTTQDSATESIDIVEKAINILSKSRSKIGAQQNRLEHTVANENNIIENTTAAESRIRDTDMAKEMVKLSMQNILEQANTSIMAQTNQSNQGVLSLLNN